jgi:hypothetical protein
LLVGNDSSFFQDFENFFRRAGLFGLRRAEAGYGKQKPYGQYDTPCPQSIASRFKDIFDFFHLFSFLWNI